MREQRQSIISGLLIVGLVVVTGVLLWSVRQTTVSKEEALASRARIAMLLEEVRSLREKQDEYLKTKSLTGDASTRRDISHADSLSKQKQQHAGRTTDPVVEFMAPAPPGLQSDQANDNKLADMANPQGESSGIIEGRQALMDLNYTDAIENFTNVDSSASDYIEARLGVANAYFYSQQYNEAMAEFVYVLKQKPDSAEAAIGLANTHHRLGQRQAEIAAYDKAINIEPDQWLHYNSRATAYLMDGNNTQAILDFQQAARLASPVKSDQATALENIGLVYLREQQWQLAFEHANEVNQIDVEHSWNWLIRGIAAAKLKRNVDAYVAYDEWFKYKRATDPYLLKQVLPESIHAFVDVTSAGLSKLVDPPLASGQVCDNDSQCLGYACRPGPPFNRPNYCVAKDKDCAAPDSNGYLINEIAVIDGIKVRCYQPESGSSRWTLDNRVVDGKNTGIR